MSFTEGLILGAALTVSAAVIVWAVNRAMNTLASIGDEKTSPKHLPHPAVESIQEPAGTSSETAASLLNR